MVTTLRLVVAASNVTPSDKGLADAAVAAPEKSDTSAAALLAAQPKLAAQLALHKAANPAAGSI